MNDDYDRVMIEMIIRSVVLGEPAPELRVAFAAAMARSRSGNTAVNHQATQHSASNRDRDPPLFRQT
ncbi:hypothetical protein [Nocardia sp. CC227C]|uniref:hypothetical protein n=1 Tax=Nocardia sp. CC227C TaxID=3044562 RepID=UPI00278C6DC6|nr:hypothetical protein [Nocardia sp. CC227C]